MEEPIDGLKGRNESRGKEDFEVGCLGGKEFVK